MTITACLLRDVGFAVQETRIRQQLSRADTRSACPTPLSRRGNTLLDDVRRQPGKKVGKLTPEIVNAIRSRTGFNYMVAAEFGFHPSTIARIRRRVIWNHI